MDIERFWVGLDLGLRRTHVCVLDDNGRVLHEEDCETGLPSVKAALAPFPTQRIGLVGVEAGPGVDLVRKLRKNGFPVVIFEARKASKFLAVRRSKTDAGDAKGLADLARIGGHSASRVYLKTPECQRLRGQLVLRKKLVLLRVAAEGSIRSTLALHGRLLKSTRAPGLLRRDVQPLLASIEAEEGINIEDELEPLLEVAESLRVYIKALDSKLEKYAASNEVCRLLMSMPGVGAICALSFYSAIEDPTRFRSATDVGAYLGLTPRRHQSGNASRVRGITKTGSKLTRTHLFIAATVFGTRAPECALKTWYLALRDRAGHRRARVALARKLAIVLLSMWKSRTGFDVVRRSLIEGAAGS